MSETCDAVVIGAGSVGLPAALSLAERGLSVLVLESLPSPGQGQNKAAIGGVRATHSDPAKILLCRQSLEVFSSWEEERGEDIGWKQGGYCFPVYEEEHERLLRGMLPLQKSYGLDIDWVDADRAAELVPGLAREGLRGGTYSPGDGQVSPLMASRAFYAACLEKGVRFLFRCPARDIVIEKGRVRAVISDRGRHETRRVLIAAGAEAREAGYLAGIDIPVTPDSHEGGVTAAVEPFLDPLVVDLRPGPERRTANFYFAQNRHGALIFCYTPAERIVGRDRRSTSEFMPVLARRLLALLPRTRHLLVRRVWRGLYPMTPDGIAIVGAVPGREGLFLACGMCGQGLMMGPGVGRNVAALMTDGAPLIDADAFASLAFDRDYAACEEALK